MKIRDRENVNPWGQYERDGRGFHRRGLLVMVLFFSFLMGSVCWSCALAAENRIAEPEIETVEMQDDYEPEIPVQMNILRQTRGADDWSYFTNDAGGITLYKYNGSDTEVVVPAAINGKPVTELRQTFYENEKIKSVTIPASVTLLNNAVFYKCTSLKTLTFKTGSTLELRGNTMTNCSALENVYGLDHTQVWIGNYEFYDCSSLVSMPIGRIMSLGKSCFKGCSALAEEYVLDSSIQTIPDYAFRDCTKIRRITGLKNTAVTVGTCAFYECSSLTAFPVAKITGLGEWSFTRCESLSESYILEGVQEIPNYAFGQCNALKAITLSQELTKLDSYALFYCSSLKELTLPEGVTEIGKFGCYGLTGVEDIDVPDSVETFGEHAFSWSTELIVGDGTAAHQYAVNSIYQTFRIRGTVVDDEIGKDAKTAEEMVNAIVEALIKPEMSDYEKALVLHDYLTRTADYDETYTRYDPEDILLGDHLGVCQAYTEAYKMLLNKVGIPNCCEYGNNHVWNMAQLGGEWVHIDCTWDDPVGGGYENHVFFAITNYALEGVRSHECYNKPHIATDPIMSYAYRYGMLNSRISGMEEVLQQALDEGVMTVQLASEILTNDDGKGILDRLGIETVGYLGLVSSWNHYPTITSDYQITGQGGTAVIDMDFDIPESSTMYLPSGLETLESEALDATIPEKIVFGNGVTTLAADFTESEPRFLIIVAPKNSPAWEWAEERNILRREP